MRQNFDADSDTDPDAQKTRNDFHASPGVPRRMADCREAPYSPNLDLDLDLDLDLNLDMDSFVHGKPSRNIIYQITLWSEQAHSKSMSRSKSRSRTRNLRVSRGKLISETGGILGVLFSGGHTADSEGGKCSARDTIPFMTTRNLPRLLLAGISGDSGKTLVALGLTAAWRHQGIQVAPFKKGPDYIDTAWLSLAAGRPAYNLDTWMMGPQTVLRAFLHRAISEGINLVEGNRGLHDGEDAAGSHSSAELSKLLGIPVVLVIPAVKMTRTVAAIVLGMKTLDRDVQIAGVILNRVATERQVSVIQASVEDATGLPVLGAIPRIDENLLPGRHLGLLTPEEHIGSREVVASAASLISQSVDLPQLRSVAESACMLEFPEPRIYPGPHFAASIRIGILRSSAFTFYYPENLEAIDRQGAEQIPVDPVNDEVLPDLDGLYIGGGFPETHAPSLSANAAFLASLNEAAQRGLPIWAECGGLIFLSRSIQWRGRSYPMAGVFPVDMMLGQTPAGHGYEEVVVDRPNPFVQVGAVLRGHEFHYSMPRNSGSVATIFRVKRGTGLGDGRDGLIYRNVVGCYLHLHALGSEEWAAGFLNAAANYAKSRVS
jgi:cobyrinic acid a,c-diamide synthase